jgi:hypothetical protein
MTMLGNLITARAVNRPMARQTTRRRTGGNRRKGMGYHAMRVMVTIGADPGIAGTRRRGRHP